MTVKDLIIKLMDYNMSADVKLVVNNTMDDFSISCGTSDGCSRHTCDTVFLESMSFNNDTPEHQQEK